MARDAADPALFRLRVFEAEWLEPLRAAAINGDVLDRVLVVEAEQWAHLGVAAGYFAGVFESREQVDAEDDLAAPIIAWLQERATWPQLDEARFAQALGAAREDLTTDRRMLLHLAVFAADAEWDAAMQALTSFRDGLVQREVISLDALPAVTWALEGALEEDPDSLGALQLDLPAGWRHGPLTALSERVPHVAARVEAVLREREEIAQAFKRINAANANDIEVEMKAIVACRDAAARQDWGRFDELFRRHLMRGYRDYLCETLGAWEETLDLAQLADGRAFQDEITPPPGYYPITIARCLKHLGRSTESRSKYLHSLRRIARSRTPDTALYVNNFLTLLIWRGELASADQLAELNVRALSWIVEPWRHCWQVEHGLSSIAYLRLLQGRFDVASVLFDQSAHAWDAHPEERRWIYDYYPYYRSELDLLTDPDAHEAALLGIESLLAVAAEKRWPESICRGHIQAALVHVDRASRHQDPEHLLRAGERLAQARRLSTGMNLPDVAIAYYLARLKADLADRELSIQPRTDTRQLDRLVTELERLVEHSGLALASSEVIAARGVQAYLDGDLEQAGADHARAVAVCRSQGYALALTSPRSLVDWLGRHVGHVEPVEPSGSTVDLIDLVGSELSDDWMLAQLDALPTAGVS